MGLAPHAFGLWRAPRSNDRSSVVAAGYASGGDAGPYSVLVKLTRTPMLIPIVLVLATWVARREAAAAGERTRSLPWRTLVPTFLIGFVLVSALTSAGPVPETWHPAITKLGMFLITTTLAGIGLSMRLSDVCRAGPRPLLLGAGLWILVGASSLALQSLTSTL